ncbi:MAG TPA: COX15/CtaA family protein, partial [Candidatus Binatus sp.]|nr:COX15/CtaA family protein [Candidatus Binatus sp.]
SSFIHEPSAISPWPHRLALLLACATFPLLFIGGLVTSLGAGLAVPDWPTTFGYHMFLYPWSKMIGGIFYEHSHRLIASSVGLITIALAWTFWTKEQRQWLRWLGVAALGLVILQGVLGGLRVVLLQQTLAIIHACLAQAFFALAVSLALFSSAEWRAPLNEKPIADGGRLRRLATVTTALIYGQIAFGAVLRHTGERIDAHLLFAVLVALHIILLLIRTVRMHADHVKLLLRPANLLTALLTLQLVLGGVSYIGKFTIALRWSYEMVVLITTTHLIIGALMLVTSLVFTLRAYRLSTARAETVGAKVLTEQFSV